MRHRKAGIKLNRTSSHRDAMFRNMVTSLFKNDRIRTTEAKAKELRRWADRMITLAKRGDLHARRQAMSIIREKDVVHKLFEQATERFGTVSGGYTRIVKIGRRVGDAAPMTLIELIAPQEGLKTKKRKKAKTPAPKPAAAPAEQTTQAAEAPQAEQRTASEESEKAAVGEESAAGEDADVQAEAPETSGDDDAEAAADRPDDTTDTEPDAEKK